MRDDKLSYKERQGLSKSQFALPGKGEGPEGKQGGSYPIPDESHARNALARVSQHGTEAEKRKVKSAVEKKFPDIKVSESKAAEEGERDIGSDAYADYVKGITPGQKATAEKKRQSTRIDDEYVPTLEEYSTHLESLEGEALEAELETLSQNELLEILGTGLVKKAGKAIVKRFSAQGRLKAAKAKGAKIQAKTDLAKQKTSNIAAKAGLKKARDAHKAAKKPQPSGNVDTRKAPGHLAAEYDHETLIGQAVMELSPALKKRYTTASAQDMASKAMREPQGKTDWEKHAASNKKFKGIEKRRVGIARANK